MDGDGFPVVNVKVDEKGNPVRDEEGFRDLEGKRLVG